MQPTERISRKRRIILLAVVVVALALVGWWWVSRPKTYRLVGKYPLADDPNVLIRPTTIGFLTQESEDLFVMHDWATGKERWRAKPAKADFHLWPGNPQYTSRDSLSVSISPDGLNLYIPTPAGNRMRVEHWQAGHLAGEVLIPLPDDVLQANPKVLSGVQPLMFACNGKRSYLELVVRFKGINRHYVFAIEGSHVVATDVQPRLVWFSSDGQTARFHYGNLTATPYMSIARVSIEGKKLYYRNKQALPAIAMLGANGTAITRGNREIVRLDGTHDVLPVPWYFAWRTSTNGRYAAFSNGEEKRESVRIVNVITGRGWVTCVRGTAFDIGPTDDGQAFVTDMRYSPISYDMTDKLDDKLPQIARLIDRKYLVLYRRNDGLIAQLELKGDLRHDLHLPAEWWYYPSPDGRSMILSAMPYEQACLLYRY